LEALEETPIDSKEKEDDRGSVAYPESD